MQLWHGTEGDVLRYPNFGEMIKQWTNVQGVSRTPAATDTPQSGWTRTRYGGTGDRAPQPQPGACKVTATTNASCGARLAPGAFTLNGTFCTAG